MTTLSSEAERLADWLQANVNIYPQVSEDEPGGYATEFDQKVDEAAALLRRIPELESSRLAPSVHEMNYRAAMTALENVKAERDQLRAELEKLRVPEGWKLVPVKPTEKMVEVGYAAINCKATSPTRLAWNAMITAAPTPPNADQKGQ